MSTYLVTLVAGPYFSISTEHHGVPFGLHATAVAGRAPAPGRRRRLLAVTRACFDRYREIFAEPYPYDSYDQAFVPELESGAVENPGCVTFRDDFLFPSAVTRAERQLRGHGDRARDGAHVVRRPGHHALVERRVAERVVRRRTWASRCWRTPPPSPDVDRLRPEPARPAATTRTSGRPRTRSRRSRGRCPTPTPPGAATTTSPTPRAPRRCASSWPGSGWPAFLAGINDYFARYRFGSATLADLLDCLSRAAGTDVGEWAGPWLRSSGVDTLTVSRPEPPGRVGCLSHAGGRPHRVWIGVYDEDPDELALRARVPVLVPADAAAVVLPAVAVRPEPALLLPNDGDFSYCKIRLDPVSLEPRCASSLGRLADPLSRAVAWNSVRDLVRDGRASRRGSTWSWPSGTCPPRPTDPSPGTCSATPAGRSPTATCRPGCAAPRWRTSRRCAGTCSPRGSRAVLARPTVPAARRDAAGRRARPDRQRVRARTTSPRCGPGWPPGGYPAARTWTPGSAGRSCSG